MKDIYSYFYDLRFSYYFYSNHLDFIIHVAKLEHGMYMFGIGSY